MTRPPAPAPLTLDPADWDNARTLAHRMVDFAVAHLRDLRARPVWQPMPEDVRTGFEAGPPDAPQPLDTTFDESAEYLQTAERGIAAVEHLHR